MLIKSSSCLRYHDDDDDDHGDGAICANQVSKPPVLGNAQMIRAIIVIIIIIDIIIGLEFIWNETLVQKKSLLVLLQKLFWKPRFGESTLA